MSHALTAGHEAPARIGPNAIVRVAEALDARIGRDGTRRLFETAALGRYLREPPERMVDEAEVTRLHRVLRGTLGPKVAAGVSFEAGLLTGDYLLANRIPKPVQALLRVLPAPLASRVLLSAIARHSWTFAGSGVFSAARKRDGVRLAIAGCPLCRGAKGDAPACAFYAGTFQRLFDALVRRGACAVEVECEALGAPACVFRVSW